mmetsp:Transcript_57458/g.151291  ORF Transcript_57458/g.151291 Transcript_57458/m.151291 type:complete len:150 (+) Transcript_57458:115-564(+)
MKQRRKSASDVEDVHLPLDDEYCGEGLARCESDRIAQDEGESDFGDDRSDLTNCRDLKCNENPVWTNQLPLQLAEEEDRALFVAISCAPPSLDQTPPKHQGGSESTCVRHKNSVAHRARHNFLTGLEIQFSLMQSVKSNSKHKHQERRQ